jgi:hypothetical protein
MKKQGNLAVLALLLWTWIWALPAFGEAPMPLPGIYILKSDMMEGSLEIRDGGAFIHLTQEELGHTAELEGPARIEGQRMTMRSLANDGAELGIVFTAGRAIIRANERAQMEYSGAHATFDGDYTCAPLGEILKKADGGDAAAQFQAGDMHYKGYFTGVAHDEARALEWFRKSAAQGSAEAQYMLGLMYENGDGGLVPDRARAMEWYRRAAARGCVPAKARLGATH